MNTQNNTGNNRNRHPGRKRGKADRSGNWQQYAAIPVNALRFLVERLLLAKELLTTPEAPRHVKVLLVGMLVYVISPVDIIPDMIPLLGITDDIAMLVMGWNYAEGFVTPQMRAKVDATLQRWS